MRTAALHTLGCKVNSYETEAMQQLLEEAGYRIVSFQESADIYIINTCSVTNMADRKSRQMLHRAKKQNPEAVVVAVGCYVQAAEEKLKQDSCVDIIIGNNQKTKLVQILEEYFAGCERGGAPSSEHVIDIARTQEYEAMYIDKIAEHTRAFIKVQDGCNQFCSYCIIPYTRGRIRSRRPEDVETEIVGLVKKGYREIVLTGIHLSSYGLDFSGEERSSLTELIERIHRIEGLERIRLGSLEPRIVTEEFARRMAALPKLCPHFHLSLQSGCDTVLKRMNRHYTTEEYARGCENLRVVFETPAITTDVIVGFPGETEEEFAATEAFLERIHFYEIHVFKYSRRAGTKAASMTDQIPDQIKNERSDKLLELTARMSLEFRESLLGKERDVLLEEKQEIGGVEYMTGHTKEYVKTAVQCGENMQNQVVHGRITKMLTDEVALLI